MTADNVYVRANGEELLEGGTSCAAPLWAGFTALVNQQAAVAGHAPVGFINPAVYQIGASAKYAAAFHDIKTGNNESPSSPTLFPAVTGYDLCTGLGSPNGQALIDALVTPEPLRILPATGFASIGGVGGPFSVNSQVYSLTNLATNTLSWSLINTSSWLNASATSGILIPGVSITQLTVSLNTTASNLLVGTYNATPDVFESHGPYHPKPPVHPEHHQPAGDLAPTRQPSPNRWRHGHVQRRRHRRPAHLLSMAV